MCGILLNTDDSHKRQHGFIPGCFVNDVMVFFDLTCARSVAEQLGVGIFGKISDSKERLMAVLSTIGIRWPRKGISAVLPGSAKGEQQGENRPD
jgi:hypothetical protein